MGITEDDLKRAMVTGKLQLNVLDTSGFEFKPDRPVSKFTNSKKIRAKDKNKRLRKYTTLRSPSWLGRNLLASEKQSSGEIDEIFNNLESDGMGDTSKLFRRSTSIDPGTCNSCYFTSETLK